MGCASSPTCSSLRPIVGFRLQKGLGLGKFARINLGKTGPSLSVGVRGARLNFGSRGTRMNVGLPGTGISYNTRLGVQAVYAPSTTSPRGGCLKAILTFILIVLAISFVAGIGSQSPVAGAVVAAIIFAVWLRILRWLQLRRAAKARALAAAAATEQQRLYAAHLAEQQRQLSLREAEEQRQRAARWSHLCGKYGEDMARRVWTGRLWLECPIDAMIEMLGPPAGVDEKVLKTKTKHTYKYRPTGVNRYDLRVFVEEDRVVGWEDKSDI